MVKRFSFRPQATLMMACRLLGCCLFILFTGVLLDNQPGFAAETAKIQNVSAIELEDRDLVRHLFNDGFLDYAEQEATAYLKKYPKGVFRDEVLFISAQASIKQNKYDAAVNYFSNLIKTYPDSPFLEDSLYYSGILQLQQGNDTDGKKRLDQLLEKFPQSRFSSKTNFQLGQLAFKKKNWTEAETLLGKALHSKAIEKNEQIIARNLIAWSLYFQGKREASRSDFIALLDSELDPANKAKIAYQLAIDAYKNRNYQEAINWFHRIIEKWPESQYYTQAIFWNAESIFLLAQDSPDTLSKDQKMAAIGLYTVNLNSSNPIEPANSHYHRGWLYSDLKLDDQAEYDFKWLQENNTDYARDIDLTIIRGTHFEASENWEQANRIYRSALGYQTDSSAKSALLTRMIRNNYRQKDCESLLKNSRQLDINSLLQGKDEIHFYIGTCYFKKSEWQQAAGHFSQIPLDSEYSPLIFEDYITTFQKTNDLSGAIEYLNQVEHHPKITARIRVLLFKAEFSLTLKRWLPAIDAMDQIASLEPNRLKDPYFLLNMAKTYDQIISSLTDPEWRKNNPTHQSAKYYNQRSLEYYEKSVELLPSDEQVTKLAILNLLVDRYEKIQNRAKLKDVLEKAIPLTNNRDEKDDLIFKLANLLVKSPSTRDQAITWLKKLHLAGNRDIYYQASTLLAELYISKKDYKHAISVLTELAGQPIDKTKWYVDTHFRLGELYQFQENWLSAVKQYDLVAKSGLKSSKIEEARKRSFSIKKFIKSQEAQKQQK